MHHLVKRTPLDQMLETLAQGAFFYQRDTIPATYRIFYVEKRFNRFAMRTEARAVYYTLEGKYVKYETPKESQPLSLWLASLETP